MNLHEAMSTFDVFEYATAEAQAGAIAAATVHEVQAGDLVYRQDDPPTDVAIVLAGRLRIVRQSPGAASERVAEVGRGEIVGELATLTGEPRSADVVAIRDTTIVRLPRERLLDLVTSSPTAAAAVLRTVSNRATATRRFAAPPSTVLVITAEGEPNREAMTRLVVRSLEAAGATTHVLEHAGAQDVERVEQAGVLAVLSPPAHDLDAVRRAARQADRVLLVVQGRPDRPSDAVEWCDTIRRSHAAPAPWELVTHTQHVAGLTAAWRSCQELTNAHHVRPDNAADEARLGRHLRGTSVGLVISGGGARALAALGALRVLREAGVPVDHVGGSSIGGLMAVLMATDEPPDELVRRATTVLQRADWGKDFTLPVVSLLSIKHAVPAFDELLGELDLADTPIPCFVTTADLTDCSLVVHDRGAAATWVRASASPPGLWPPVIDSAGHIHVDGGIINNLPVDEMIARGAKTVVAINISLTPTFGLRPGTTEAHAWHDVLRRRRRGEEYPSITDLLFRMGIVASLPAQRATAPLADVTIRPQLDHVGLADYASAAAIVAEGERAARAALEHWTTEEESQP